MIEKPGWAKYVVRGCFIMHGTFWASNLTTAKLIKKYHGGSIEKA